MQWPSQYGYDQMSVLRQNEDLADNTERLAAATQLKRIQDRRVAKLDDLLDACHLISPLFNALQGIVFFIKDDKSRYVLANLTLAQRCGHQQVVDILGQTSQEIFPYYLGQAYTQQDLDVLDSGRSLLDCLELHLFPGREPGWALTNKIPVMNNEDKIIGLAGFSQDLPTGNSSHPAYGKIAIVQNYIAHNFNQLITSQQLEQASGLSTSQLERYCKRIYQLTPRQLIHKERISHASRWLTESDRSITEIGLDCGYSDHSAFTRQFKAMTGMAPQQFRQISRNIESA